MPEQNTPRPEFAFLKGGGEMSSLIAAYDWPATALGSIDTWPQNLRAAVSLMLKSRFPMLIFWGPQLVTFYNDAFRPSLGDDGKHPGSLGQRGEESWAESWPVIGPMIYDIMKGGEAVWFEDQKLPLYRDGEMGYAYWTYSFSPVDDGDGNVAGLLVTCAETTEAVEGLEKLTISNQQLEASLEENRALQKAQLEAHLQVKESQQQLLSLFEQAPVAIATISRDQLIFTNANTFYSALVGRNSEDLIGTPMIEALPELAGQGFDHLLYEVLQTGIAYTADEAPAQLLRSGVLEKIYVNLAYMPMQDESGKTAAVLVVATDVTAQVLSRQLVSNSEASLRSAIELAELGTWSLDVASGEVTYSERLRQWLGISGSTHQPQGSPQVHPDDRGRISRAVSKALARGGDGHYDEVYTILHTTGATRIIHAVGQATYDDSGKAEKLSGTAQDVTIQRDLQKTLEDEVQVRTEELQAMNEELADFNNRLSHSNEELAQYAYVASHDLQEPLRKIQVFSGMLNEKKELADSSRELVAKIGQSANRMGLLIRDLLEFSRLLNSDALFRPTDLNDIVAAVCGDFELVAAEKAAVFHLGRLPVVEAVSLQMNQVFYNLISNALKFTRPGVAPELTISAEAIGDGEAARYIQRRPPGVQYYRISVHDNGIGFDAQYSEQIFEVFKRLHSREAYAGSGIGLALCRRILGNHSGALYTESVPGAGSAFHLVLPDRQEEQQG